MATPTISGHRRAAKIDEIVPVARPGALELAAGAEVVVTPTGLVVIEQYPGWTYYRWMMAGQLWSVTKEPPDVGRAAHREAAYLIGQCRERYRRPASVPGRR